MRERVESIGDNNDIALTGKIQRRVQGKIIAAARLYGIGNTGHHLLFGRTDQVDARIHSAVAPHNVGNI